MFPLIAPLFYIQDYLILLFPYSMLCTEYCMVYCSLELHPFAIWVRSSYFAERWSMKQRNDRHTSIMKWMTSTWKSHGMTQCTEHAMMPWLFRVPLATEYYYDKFNSAVASFACWLPQAAWRRTEKLIGSGRLHTFVLEFRPRVYLKMPSVSNRWCYQYLICRYIIQE